MPEGDISLGEMAFEAGIKMLVHTEKQLTPELILTSSVVSAIVSAIVGPAMFHFLKSRDERVRRQFETKFSEFKHYLNALEEISRFSGEEFSKYMKGPAQKCMATILTCENEFESNLALVEMNREMNEFVLKLTSSFQKSTSELHGLRLISSSGLFEMVNEYVRIQEKILNESISLMGKMKFSQSGDVEVAEDSALRLMGAASKKMFESIIVQMRVELGTGKS